MNIYSINNSHMSLNAISPYNNNRSCCTAKNAETSLPFDKFEKTHTLTTFTGNNSSKKQAKRIEDMLKNIDGLHDPYSDVLMISSRRFKQFQDKLSRKNSADKTINLLSEYKAHMFPSEYKIYEMLRNDVSKAKKEGNSSKITFTDILQEHLPEAKTRLVNAQLDVTDSIKELVRKNKISKEDKEYVDLYLAIIEKDIYNDKFRIKSSRELLKRLENEMTDKVTAKEIIKLTKNFPNTATNSDAFIVKNYDKSQEEIAELLISPAQISIEHIKPTSVRGEDKASNYLAASKRMNNYRRSIPLSELIEEYPNIPKQTQRYFNELIQKVNRGGLQEIGVTIPDVKERLFEESDGLIDVNLSALNPDVIKKTNLIKNKLGELLDHFKN